MTMTSISDVQNQIQKFWSKILMEELKQDTLLPSLVNRTYDGQITRGGDTVYVSQVTNATGSTKTIGVDHDSYTPEKMVTQRIPIVANKIFEATFKLDSLIDIQSQLDDESSESPIRKALLNGLNVQMNNFCYSFVNPSPSNPDLVTSGVTDFNATAASAARMRASQARWAKDGKWFGLLDPSYFSDFLVAASLVSLDNGASDEPLIGGQFGKKRFGFTWLEDNSDGILTLAPAAVDAGLLFHQDWMHLVLGQPLWKLSDLHSSEKRGHLLSVEIIGGGALGIDGNVKHQRIYNS